jgi:hypothetical protein
MGGVLLDGTGQAIERALDERLGPRPAPPALTARQRNLQARRLRKLWRAAGYDQAVDDQVDRALRDRLYPPAEGGATGQGGMAFVSNLPADRFRMDPNLFEQATERQDIPQQQAPFNGFGSNWQVRLQNVGVLAMVHLWFTGTLTVGGSGAVTALPGFPYSLMRRVQFNANGQTSLISATGVGLRARRARIFRNPAESLEVAPLVGTIPNGTYNVSFMVTVPVSHDMLTGIGWVLAQNPSTGLTLDIATANQADMFSVAAGGTVALTGTLYPTITTFAVGQAMAGNQAVTVVPDLTVFHGFLENDAPVQASGIAQAPLIRTAGQLVNYFFNLANGPGFAASEIDPAALSEIQFRYGGNRQPRVYNPPQVLLEKNQADYNGLVKVRGLTHTFLDFEADNPRRDLFIPEALVELLAQVTIPNSVTVNAGAHFHYGEETLYPAV